MSGQPMLHAQVVDTDIDLADIVRLVSGPGCGAVATFTGLVRELDHDRRVTELEYVAHDSANRVILEVARDVAAQHDLVALAVVHRMGTLRVGDVAVVIAAAAAHRGEALAACAAAIEEVKHRLPMWKRQVFDDGTDEWVNSP